MKIEMDINTIGDLLAQKASAANRETVKFYGEDNAAYSSRIRFISQVQLIRDLGITVELVTNEDPGKELYTAIRLNNQEYTIKAQG